MNDLTRRDLLKSAALGSAAVAALGAGVAIADEAPAAEDDALAGKHTWEVKPDPIPADQITETIDTEIAHHRRRLLRHLLRRQRGSERRQGHPRREG